MSKNRFHPLLVLSILAVFIQSCFGQNWTDDNCQVQCFTSNNCASGCNIQEVCPTGWNGKLARLCYTVVVPTTPGFTVPQAQARCQATAGAVLASVHSQQENQMLISLMRAAPNPDGKNHVYWIGMQLARNGAAVTGATWLDTTPLDFGNPVSGRGQDPWAIGEPVNAGNCVRMMNYGPFRGKWYDADCNQNTNLVPTQGFFCKGCPTGWTYFQGHCYRAFTSSARMGGLANFTSLCGLYNAKIVSIHSQAENDLVLNLVKQSDPTVWAIMIGLNMPRVNGALQTPFWADGSPLDFGSNIAGGVAPWADAGTGWPPQPDGSPNNPQCTMMWVDSSVPSGNKQPGRWDDITCANTPLAGTVCKF